MGHRLSAIWLGSAQRLCHARPSGGTSPARPFAPPPPLVRAGPRSGLLGGRSGARGASARNLARSFVILPSLFVLCEYRIRHGDNCLFTPFRGFVDASKLGA